MKEEENKDIIKALEAIDATAAVLLWTREKLVAAQEENRKLKRIIMELTEGCDGKHT